MRRMVRPWPVAFKVKGLNIERFVRYAGEEGIHLMQIRRPSRKTLTALVREDELSKLQEIAMRGGWHLTAGSRKGAGRAAEWLYQRWILAAAAISAGIALLAASQVMWRVEIIDGGVYEADIRAAVSEFGISSPMLRRKVEPGELRDALEWRYPRIAWFECGWRGTTLVIRPVEGVLPLQEDGADGSRDIVAVRDGVIHSIVTRAGTPVVKVGDVVRTGEILIKGEERTSEGAVRPVAARGSVIARVWRGASVQLPATETVTQYTGRTESVRTVRTPWFDLWPMDTCNYAQYDTSVSEMAFGGIFLPMVLHMETHMEAECTLQMRDVAELEAEAYEAAQRKLNEKIGREESMIDIWGNCSMIDAENIVSVAIGEMLVDIGTQVPASGMAAPEEHSSE